MTDNLTTKSGSVEAEKTVVKMKSKGAQQDARAKFGRDGLLAALDFFVGYYRLSHSTTSMTSGLPLKDGRLTPGLFTRALSRGGMAGRVVKRRMFDVNAHVLPVVLMMPDGRVLIWLSREGDGDELDQIATLDPLAEELVKWPTLGQFMKENNLEESEVYLIFVRMGLRLELTKESRGPIRRWFWSVMEKFKPLYAKALVASAIINILAILTSLYVMNVYDRVVPNGAYETLWVLSGGVLIAYVFDFMFRQLRAYFVDSAGKGADILLSSRIYEHVLNSRLGQRKTSAGAFANQLRDYESVREFFMSGTILSLIDLPFVLLFLVVIFMLGGSIVILPIFFMCLMIAVSWMIQLPVRELVVESAKEMDLKHGHLIETINGLENIKAIGSLSHAQGRWEQLSGVSAKIGKKTKYINNIGVNLCYLLPNLNYTLVIMWGAHLIIMGEMTMGSLVACSIMLGRAMAPISQAASLMLRYQQVKTSLDSLSAMMMQPVERPAGKEFVHLGAKGHVVEGGIRFENVDFAYPHTPLNSLMHVNCTIKPGERVGIVGRAGSGKSTFARLILNLYEPKEGSLFLDGLDVRQIDPAELRKNVCYFPQNLYLFKGSLRENLLLANPNATDDVLLQAVEVSGAYRMIRRHPMGFDMPIGERGENLSGGQRQMVGLARALMHDGKIAVLDDPTSEMDATSENWVKERLGKWLKDRTLILITHRPSMLDLVDRLLVIDDGRLIADGPKKKILDLLASGQLKTS